MPYYIGIDIGTTGLKSILTDRNGTILAKAYRSYPIDTPKPLYAEQDPELWYAALKSTVREIMGISGVKASEVAGIGLSGQMHGTVLLDRAGNLLCPAIIWCDQRSKEEVQLIQHSFSTEELCRLVQNPAATGFQLSSILWLKKNRPEIYDRVAHIMLPKDYIRFRLTGVTGTEPSDACGTLLYDGANHCWSGTIAELFNIDKSLLPNPDHLSCERAGTLTKKAAEDLGLSQNVYVVYGGGDQPMQALGNGAVTNERAVLTLGTGGQVFMPTRTPLHDPQLRIHSFCHAEKDIWYNLGATLNCCLAQNWALKNIFGISGFNDAHALALNSPAGSRGLFFLPYISGERTPYMNPEAKGIFWGMCLSHSKEDMLRAVIEGISYSLWDAYDCVVSLSGPPKYLIVTGGGSKSPLWRQILSDMLNTPVYTTNAEEEACMGAAICAMTANGEYDSLSQACAKIIQIDNHPSVPTPENSALYTENREKFHNIYSANARLF